MIIANIAPIGIDFLGSFKSPDILTPAPNPVTAGKKIPNKTINGKAVWVVLSNGHRVYSHGFRRILKPMKVQWPT